jgi:hypothetical protein
MLAAFLAALVLYFVATHRMIRGKMLKVQAPAVYLRTFMRARWLSYLTIVLMLAVMLGAGVVREFIHHGVGR